MEILNLQVPDSGSYTCEVSNNAGSESCNTVIAVKGLSHPDTHGPGISPGIGPGVEVVLTVPSLMSRTTRAAISEERAADSGGCEGSSSSAAV